MFYSFSTQGVAQETQIDESKKTVNEQTSEDNKTVEHIVIISSEKRDVNIQDVPMAVSAFSSEDLNDFGIFGMKSLQNAVPGLVFNNTGSIAQPYLRGIGTRLALNGLESSIAIYSDDRYLSRATSSIFDFADVERVEVLKGPQGTLYGRNATGGAIRVITRDVSESLEGKLSVGVGNYSSYNLSGTVSGPLSDSLLGRFSVLTKQRAGYADNLSPLGVAEFDDQDFQAYRTKLRWQGDILSAQLTLDYWRRHDLSGIDIVDLSPPGLNLGIALGGISGQYRDEVASALPSKEKAKEFSGQLVLEVEFDSADFTSISTFTDLEHSLLIDADGTSANTLDVLSSPDIVDEYSQEFQIISNNVGPWEWIIGVNYFNSAVDFDLVLDVGIGSHISSGLQKVKTTAWALYGQSTRQINERWAVTLGGRWSDEKKQVSQVASVDAFTLTAGLPFQDHSSWSDFTPKATLEYKLPDTLFYLTYAEGFKSGGYNYPAKGNNVLEPETLKMLELGMKGDFLDNRLRLNMSLYVYDYADLQVSRNSGGDPPVVTTENAADAEVIGFDADIVWRITDRFSLTTGVNLLDTEYKEYDASAKVFSPPTAGMTDIPYDASGQSLLRAPDWSYFLTAVYEFSWNAASLPLVISYARNDDYLFDFIVDPLSARLRQQEYGILTARFSYIAPDGDWQIAIWGNNLTDEEYYDDISGNPSGIRGSWGEPPTYGIEVSYSF